MKSAKSNFHEEFASEHPVQGPSDRSFGFTMAGVLAFIGVLKWWSGGGHVAAYLIGVAALFFCAAMLKPGWLGPLNRLWLKFGLVLYRLVNPVVMAVFFLVVITPVALLLRAFGKRPLRLAMEPDAPTYWIERRPPGPAPETMTRQF